MMDGYLSEEELKMLGLKEWGGNVLISRKASIYMPEQISIASNVRIDDFCILIGNITIGNYVHIAPYSGIHGTGGGSVEFGDYSGTSSSVMIYAGSDDYSGEYMTNPVVPVEYRNTISSHIRIGKHSVIGVHSALLPGAELAEGTSVGAMSLVKDRTEPWGIYAGVPCRRIGERSRNALRLEEELVQQYGNA